MTQDRLLELPELLAGLQPEALRQLAPRITVGTEGLGLAGRAVEREHQLAAQALPERVVADKSLQLTHEPRVAPAGKIGIDPPLERRQAQLLEPSHVGLGEGLVGQVGERGSAPERERVAQLLRRAERIVRARLRHEPLEAGEVELGRLDVQNVPRCPRGEPSVPERLAQPGHVDLDALGGRRWRRLPPELVDQPLRGDDLVGVQQEDRQHGTAA